VFRNLTSDLPKKSARWAPQCLTAEQKQTRLEIAALLKQRFNVEGQAFVYLIVTIDETWVTEFEPHLKCSQTSGEVQIPRYPNYSDERNQRSRK
jgi:hypothetical protein